MDPNQLASSQFSKMDKFRSAEHGQVKLWCNFYTAECDSKVRVNLHRDIKECCSLY